MIVQIIERHLRWVVVIGLLIPLLLKNFEIGLYAAVCVVGYGVAFLAQNSRIRHAELKAEIAALQAQLAAAPLPARDGAPGQG